MFARVKAELPDSLFPEFKGVLAWLKGAWDYAPKPRGRPPETQIHLFVASWIELLSAPHFDLEMTEGGSPTVLRKKPLMSFVDAIDVLRGECPEVGQTFSTSPGSKPKFGGLHTDTLREIHKEFSAQALKEFRVVPSLEAREARRILQWYRCWREATHRIYGNKIRGRRSDE